MNIEKMLTECRAHWEATKPDAVFADYWLGWQASRESLVIELPYVHGYPANEAASDQDYYIDQAKADMRHQCRKAIESLGLKVKS